MCLTAAAVTVRATLAAPPTSAFAEAPAPAVAPADAVVVRVVDARGAAVAGAAVAVLDKAGTVLCTASTDRNGQASCRAQGAGPATVQVTMAGFATNTVSVTLGNGRAQTLRIVLMANAPQEKSGHDKGTRADAKRDAKPVKLAEATALPSAAPIAPMGSIGHGRIGSLGGVGRGAGSGYGAGGAMKAKRAASASVNQVATRPMPALAAPQDDSDRDHNTEEYSRIDDNPFVTVAHQPLSTFSADVDTASYANVRRFLRDGQKPPADAVRVEELLNYFRYADALPTGNDPFGVTTELTQSPWHTGYQLLRIGLRTQAIADAAVPARNLVFLLDVSGSMMSPNKLPLLKQAMTLLVNQMRPQDRIAIAVYAGAAGLVLPSTSGREKDTIRTAIELLQAGGSTNGAAGIALAYQTAQQHFIKGGINRVILCTDGDFNVGPSSEGELTRMIEEKREHGVFLTVLGFGMGNVKDGRMEKLADRGNGNYGYIDSLEEARKVLVKEAGATLVTVAKDVKLQLEFNPAKVAGYRLIGYENRMLRAEDFNDDKKDAGEMGAGHSVTALYELIPAGAVVPGAQVDALKYQPVATPGAVTVAANATSREWLTVKLRYKAPTENTSQLMSRVVDAAPVALAQASENVRWAAAVASFGMLLRGSKHVGTVTWRDVVALAQGAKGQDLEGYRAEFIALAKQAAALGGPATQLAK